MKKALVLGLDYYEHVNQLNGCVNDAYSVKQVLERHSDGTKNFDIVIGTSTSSKDFVTKGLALAAIKKLFEDPNEIALLYFSGHGAIDGGAGYICTSECRQPSDGISMDELLDIVNNSPASNKIVVLDSCFAGAMGNVASVGGNAVLTEGTTILSASTAQQTAACGTPNSVFTSLLIDALNGSASNLLGDITPGSVYAHIDQSLGAWDQRPVFKTNVRNFVTLRKVNPPIALADLKQITTIFSNKGVEYPLDPSYEFTDPTANPQNVSTFKLLQKFNRLNLVVPCGEEYMYFAAMNSKSCKLTILGEHYWNLVNKDRI